MQAVLNRYWTKPWQDTLLLHKFSRHLVDSYIVVFSRICDGMLISDCPLLYNDAIIALSALISDYCSMTIVYSKTYKIQYVGFLAYIWRSKWYVWDSGNFSSSQNNKICFNSSWLRREFPEAATYQLTPISVSMMWGFHSKNCNSSSRKSPLIKGLWWGIRSKVFTMRNQL